MEKVVLRWVPRPVTTGMIASAMPVAMRPYSIAVAPDSSFRKVRSVRIIASLISDRPKASVKPLT